MENSKQLQSQSQSHTIVQYLNRHRFPKKRISHIQLLLEHDSVYCWNTTVNMKRENVDVDANSGHEQETEGQSHPAIGIKTEDNTASSVNPTTAANQRQEYNLETDEHRQYVANLEEQCSTLRCNLMNEQ